MTAHTASLLEPGSRLNRYELLCRIGQGGMATVWLARTEGTRGEQRLVAIKTILPDLVADESVRLMLFDEARIATALDHPNVAATLEVGEHRGMPYLVMEYVPGQSVEVLCRSLGELGLPIPAAVVIRIVADAATGLHAAHELMGTDGSSLQIVHRDVAPPNILVDERGRARVIDFGVAKANERFTPQTARGAVKGRVPFMAPEHASAGAVDRRADIWALGAVAYFMLTGRHPFEAPTDAARVIRILGTDGPDPLPESLAPAVRDVILRALAKDPDERPATAAALAAALESAQVPASREEVAQFVLETLPGEVRARRQLVESALAAAEARAGARALLDAGPTGQTMSYRPQSAPALITPPPPGIDDGKGSLETVTRQGSIQPPTKPWVPWVTAGAVGAIVIAAFMLGSLTERAAANGAAVAPSAPIPATTPIPIPTPTPKPIPTTPIDDAATDDATSDDATSDGG